MKKSKPVVRPLLDKKQEGNYWDSFLKFDFDYDKRNQKFQTSDGFRSFYSLDVPVISETNSLKMFIHINILQNYMTKIYQQFLCI